MHHGTCSDYNQYCPNARLNRSQLGFGGLRHSLLASQHPQQIYNQSPPPHYLLNAPFRKNLQNNNFHHQSQSSLAKHPTIGSAYQPLLPSTTIPAAAAGQFNSYFRTPPPPPGQVSGTPPPSSTSSSGGGGGGGRGLPPTGCGSASGGDPFNYYRTHLFQYFYQPGQHSGGGIGGAGGSRIGIYPVLSIINLLTVSVYLTNDYLFLMFNQIGFRG